MKELVHDPLSSKSCPRLNRARAKPDVQQLRFEARGKRYDVQRASLRCVPTRGKPGEHEQDVHGTTNKFGFGGMTGGLEHPQTLGTRRQLKAAGASTEKPG